MAETAIAHRAEVPEKSTEQVDLLLLDGSGSMASQWWDVQAALDSYIFTTSRSIDARMILSVFGGSNAADIQRDCKMSEWQPLMTHHAKMPGGGTPLFDAINAAARMLRDANPLRATFIIATDGQETSSHHTTREQAKAILDWCRAQGWQVIFIGLDYNSDSLAKDLGATEQQSLPINRKLIGHAAETLAKKRANYGIYGSDISFTEEERKKYLPKPK